MSTFERQVSSVHHCVVVVASSGRLIHAGGRQKGRLGMLADEAFGMGRVGGVENQTASAADELGPAVVDVGGGGNPMPE